MVVYIRGDLIRECKLEICGRPKVWRPLRDKYDLCKSRGTSSVLTGLGLRPIDIRFRSTSLLTVRGVELTPPSYPQNIIVSPSHQSSYQPLLLLLFLSIGTGWMGSNLRGCTCMLTHTLDVCNN